MTDQTVKQYRHRRRHASGHGWSPWSGWFDGETALVPDGTVQIETRVLYDHPLAPSKGPVAEMLAEMDHHCACLEIHENMRSDADDESAIDVGARDAFVRARSMLADIAAEKLKPTDAEMRPANWPQNCGELAVRVLRIAAQDIEKASDRLTASEMIEIADDLEAGLQRALFVRV